MMYNYHQENDGNFSVCYPYISVCKLVKMIWNEVQGFKVLLSLCLTRRNSVGDMSMSLKEMQIGENTPIHNNK